MDKKAEIAMFKRREAAQAAASAPQATTSAATATLAATATASSPPTSVGEVPSGWWMYHGGPDHVGYVSDSDLNSGNINSTAFATLFTLQLGGPILSVPAIVDGFIYVGIANYHLAEGGNGGALHKIDIQTGETVKTFSWNLGNNANNIAIGFHANAVGDGVNNTAVGANTVATGANASAFGNGAQATFANSTAVGSGAVATRANQQVFGTASNTYTMSALDESRTTETTNFNETTIALAAGLARELTPMMRYNLSLGYTTTEDRSPVQRTDDTYNLSTGLNFLLNNGLTASATYGLVYRRSTTPGQDVRENSFILGIRKSI